MTPNMWGYEIPTPYGTACGTDNTGELSIVCLVGQDGFLHQTDGYTVPTAWFEDEITALNPAASVRNVRKAWDNLARLDKLGELCLLLVVKSKAVRSKAEQAMLRLAASYPEEVRTAVCETILSPGAKELHNAARTLAVLVMNRS